MHGHPERITVGELVEDPSVEWFYCEDAYIFIFEQKPKLFAQNSDGLYAVTSKVGVSIQTSPPGMDFLILKRRYKPIDRDRAINILVMERLMDES